MDIFHKNALHIHGSAVQIGNNAVIIIGDSGTGKSDLALRLIDRGAKLIADDQMIIHGDKNTPIISQTQHHIDAIEIRGVGIIKYSCVNNVPLTLCIKTADRYDRYPVPIPMSEFGVFSIPTIKIAAFENSAPIKVEMALKNIHTITAKST